MPWVLRALLVAQQKKELRTTVVKETVREGVLEVTSGNTVGGFWMRQIFFRSIWILGGVKDGEEDRAEGNHQG